MHALCHRIPAISIAGYNYNLLVFMIATDSQMNLQRIRPPGLATMLNGATWNDTAQGQNDLMQM